MVENLLKHELTTLKFFFDQSMTWVNTKADEEHSMIIKMGHPDNDTIEGILTHPHSSYSFEQFVIRSVINELNSLCEFALQNTWFAASKQYNLPNGEFVYTANRGNILNALSKQGM